MDPTDCRRKHAEDCIPAKLPYSRLTGLVETSAVDTVSSTTSAEPLRPIESNHATPSARHQNDNTSIQLDHEGKFCRFTSAHAEQHLAQMQR